MENTEAMNEAVGSTDEMETEVDELDSGSDSSDEGEAVESFEEYVKRSEKEAGVKEEPAKKKAKPQAKEETEADESENEDEQGSEEDEEQDSGKIWKLKVNEKEYEVDSSNTDQIKQLVQKGLSAQQRYTEAAAIRNQAQSFINALKNDPVKVLTHPSLGLNFRDVAEKYLYQQLQHDNMSDEEKQQHAEKEELEKYRAEELERKRSDEQKKLEKLKEEYRENYQQQFIEALKESNIPKNDWSIKRMADYMREAIRRGAKNITPKQIAPLVKQDWENAQRELLSSLDGDDLINMLGKETAEKIRKHQIAQAQKNDPFNMGSGRQPAQGSNRQRGKNAEPKYRSVYDLANALMR